MENSSAKRIVVLEENGYTIEVLRKILGSCKKENYRAVGAGPSLPAGTPSSVLLLCGRECPAGASAYGACVADRESAFQPGFNGLSHLTTYSVDRNDADFTAKNIRTARDGSTAFEIVGSCIIGRVRLGANVGVSGVRSALAAASAAIAAGIPFADVLQALNAEEPVRPPGDDARTARRPD